MFRNKKFGFYAVTLCLAGLLYTFLCAGLEGGQLEVIRGRIAGAEQDADFPMTLGAFLAAPAVALAMTAFLRMGVRQGLILCGGLAALGCIGLINARDAYWLFFLSMILTRCACTALRAGIAVLCARWFIRYRGRALGLVTMGAPLFSAVGAAAVANFIQTRLGGDHRPFYLAVAAALALLALAVRFLLRDTPEDAGLYPDGDGYAPEGESAQPEPPLTAAQLFKSWRFWLTLAVTGAMAAAAAGCLGSLEAHLLAKGGESALLAQAGPWLALGAILAIPASYIFGWLCDRLGEVWTALPLLLAEAGCAYLLWTFPEEVDAATGAPLCLAAALLMGGVSTAAPALIARVCGRRQFLPVCRVLFPALLLLAALADQAAGLPDGGQQDGLCAALIAVAAVGLLSLPFLGHALAKDRKRR